MSIGETLSIAFRSLTSNKSRALLTMLGVIIGVAAVIIMLAISAGTEATIAEQINGLGSNLLFISPNFGRGGPGQPENRSGGLVYSDVAAIQALSGVAGVSVEQNSNNQNVKFGTNSLTGISLVGTTPDYTTVRGVQIASGRWFRQSDVDQIQKVAVLGSSIANQLFGNTDPIGQEITVNTTKLTVIGVLQQKGAVSGTDFDSTLYAPIKTVFQKFTFSEFARVFGDRVRTIYVSVSPTANMDDVITQISLLLEKRHKVTAESPDFSIQTQQAIISTRESTTATFRTLLAWVAGVSLIVGGIGIMNIMLVSVSERTREIGLRQAVGATPGDIQIQFLSEALMLSLIGGLIGVLVGVGGSYLFGKLGNLRTVIVPYSIGLSFASAALVGIFFGYVPAQKAAQLDPIDALRHE